MEVFAAVLVCLLATSSFAQWDGKEHVDWFVIEYVIWLQMCFFFVLFMLVFFSSSCYFPLTEFFTDLLASSKLKFHKLFQKTYGIIYERNSDVFIDFFKVSIVSSSSFDTLFALVGSVISTSVFYHWPGFISTSVLTNNVELFSCQFSPIISTSVFITDPYLFSRQFLSLTRIYFHVSFYHWPVFIFTAVFITDLYLFSRQFLSLTRIYFHVIFYH